MAVSPAWLSLDVALRRLVARGSSEVEAKSEICDAIAELRLRVAIEIVSQSDALERVEAVERIEIPASLAPQDLDWTASRPAAVDWQIRSDAAPEEWETLRVARLEVDANDFAVELCGDLASIALPDRPPPIGDPSHAQARWAPWRATPGALKALAGREKIPLSEAVSILAFASPAEAAAGGERESAARRRQAVNALCAAAAAKAVAMAGRRDRRDARVESIPFSDFAYCRAIGDDPNSLVADRSRELERNRGRRRPVRRRNAPFLGAWTDVSVAVDSLCHWLDEQIVLARRRRLERQRSRRLFKYQFWSFETVRRWIAYRNPDRLAPRTNEGQGLIREALIREALSAPPVTSATIETLPDHRLLVALQRGAVTARDRGETIPNANWADARPTPDGLSHWLRSMRLARDDALRVFPQLTRPPAEIVARRRAMIGELAERWRQTGTFINCYDFARTLDESGTEGQSKERVRPRTLAAFGKAVAAAASRPGTASRIRLAAAKIVRLPGALTELREAFEAGAFGSDTASRMRLLRADSRIVRLRHAPIQRDLTDVLAIRGQPGPDYFADCWLSVELCRDWAARYGLSLSRFDKARQPNAAARQAERPLIRQDGNPRKTGAGLSSDWELYRQEYMRRRAGELFRNLQYKKEIATSLASWGKDNNSITKKISAGRLEKIIGEYIQDWRDDLKKS